MGNDNYYYAGVAGDAWAAGAAVGSAAAETLPTPSWWEQNKQSVSPGFYGFSAGYDAMNARRKAQTQKNALNFEAQTYANQAAMAGYQAQIAQQVGAVKEQNSRLQTAADFGKQRAQLGASGIDLGQGSATDVLASTEYMGERDAMMIRDDTNRQVWQDRNQQAMYQTQQQADLARMNAINPEMAAFGSLLGSAGSFIPSPVSLGE